MIKIDEDVLYQKLLDYLKPRSLSWIMKDLLTTRELDSIASKSGLHRNSKEVSSVAPDVIADDIAYEFFKRPQVGKMLIKALLKRRLREVNKLEKMDPVQIKNYLGDGKLIFNENRVGKILWAIIIDDRNEVNREAVEFTQKIEKIINSYVNNKKNNGKTTETPLASKNKEVRPVGKPKNVEIPQDKKNKKVEENKFAKSVIDLNRKRRITNSLINQQSSILQKENQMLKQELKDAQKALFDQEQLFREKKTLEKENKKLVGLLEELQNKREKESTSSVILQRKNMELRGELARWDIKYKKLKRNVNLDRTRGKGEDNVITNSRVGIFVDVQNIYYGAKIGYQAKLNFHKLLDLLIKDRHLQAAIAYIVQTPEINQEEFIKTLDRVGYKVKSKDLRRRADGSAKGDWDLGIAMDIISLQDKLDVVVLVSGDGDFVDLIRVLKRDNITVEVAAFQHNTSRDLIEIADTFYPLEEDMTIINQ